MARNKSEREPIEKLLAYARACKAYYEGAGTGQVGKTWTAIGSNERLKIDYMSRRVRMLHIFSKHGTDEDKIYRGL